MSWKKNEIKDVWIKVTERDGGTVTVSSQDFEAFDKDDTSVQASDTASISGNGTAEVKIYGLVDTTADSFVAGSSYYVRFTYVIGSETYIEDVWLAIT